MKNFLSCLLIISFSVLFLSGCATDPSGNLIFNGKALGIVAGTVAGAAAGAAIGNKHPVVGAVVGGVAGAVISCALIELSKKAVLAADRNDTDYIEYDQKGNKVVARRLTPGGYEECKWISREIYDKDNKIIDYSKEKVCEGKIVQTIKG